MTENLIFFYNNHFKNNTFKIIVFRYKLNIDINHVELIKIFIKKIF